MTWFFVDFDFMKDSNNWVITLGYFVDIIVQTNKVERQEIADSIYNHMQGQFNQDANDGYYYVTFKEFILNYDSFNPTKENLLKIISMYEKDIISMFTETRLIEDKEIIDSLS